MKKWTINVKATEEFDGGRFEDLNICMDGMKIGYVELYKYFPDGGEEYGINFGYVKSIELIPEYRGQRIGTEILKSLANECHHIFIYADNDRAECLYKRLGDVTDNVPDVLECEEYDVMYVIY